MPLESPSRPGELNENWPLPSDAALLGDAHLRTIKKMLKGNILGSFNTRALLTSFYETAIAAGFQMQPGCLAFVSGRWYALQNITAGANTVNNEFCFPVISTVQAIAVSQSGALSAQNSSGLVNINSTQRRRPLVSFLQIPGATDFDVVAANASFPDGVAVGNDVCIQLLPAASGQAQIRFFNGSSWNPVDNVNYSREVTYSFLASQMISAVSVDSRRVRTRQLEVLGTTNLYVVDPDGFGPDDLIKWFGSKNLVTGLDGEIAYSAMTIANAISYEKKDGRQGFGGQAPDPIPPAPTDATVLSGLGTLGTNYLAENAEYQNNSANATLNLTFKPDGTFVISAFRFRTGEPPSGAYLSAVAAGIGAQFEIRFTAIGGTNLWFSGTLDTWMVINVDRTVSITALSDFANTPITRSQQVQIEIRKIGGSAVSKTVTISATATTFPNEIP